MSDLQDLLPLYYKRLFPFSLLVEWLGYETGSKCFENREFSFTLANDVYIRYLSFDDQDAFEKETCKVSPCKIDIGAVYSLKPKEHRMKDTFQPIERELVFDIDMTDYDEIRTCCTGANVCKKCWKYLAVACKVLDVIMREDFGYNSLLWVFSGRRGIHCWVCDKDVRILSSVERSSLVEYLQVIGGGEKTIKRVTLSGDVLHPSLNRAIRIIKEYFIPVCIVEQDILGIEDKFNKFLSLIEDTDLRQGVQQEMNKYRISSDRWSAFTNYVLHYQKTSGKRRIKYVIEEIMLQYMYPRLDASVSKSMNHLLKSPFCVHPKTGKICVPFHIRNVDSFDVATVPTIIELLDEVAEYDKKAGEVNEEGKKVKDFKKTSLNKSVSVFREFLKCLQSKQRAKQPLELF